MKDDSSVTLSWTNSYFPLSRISRYIIGKAHKDLGYVQDLNFFGRRISTLFVVSHTKWFNMLNAFRQSESIVRCNPPSSQKVKCSVRLQPLHTSYSFSFLWRFWCLSCFQLYIYHMKLGYIGFFHFHIKNLYCVPFHDESLLRFHFVSLLWHKSQKLKLWKLCPFRDEEIFILQTA